MSDGLSEANRDPECPGAKYTMCTGATCNLCGAGCWSQVRDCVHDVLDRHADPVFGATERRGEGSKP